VAEVTTFGSTIEEPSADGFTLIVVEVEVSGWCNDCECGCPSISADWDVSPVPVCGVVMVRNEAEQACAPKYYSLFKEQQTNTVKESVGGMHDIQHAITTTLKKNRLITRRAATHVKRRK
jgi:hypothetical protein